MEFIADFHVHSKHSRATAKNLDLEHLYIAAQIKGITVVGTGDFTHPGWFSEIREKLEPAEPGLFRLKAEIADFCDAAVPPSCRSPVRFILATEISNIYKKAGRTRKNHNLVFLPSIGHADTFNATLDAIGNISSDGRPILGLDAKHLLEIVLNVTQEGFLVPAHIWTPWFSLLGSKSGFDAVEECFEDLTPYIFAVETGLSSDPPMNRRVSGLDGLTLMSNSDAHSPFYIGREANRFNAQLDYAGIKSALETGDPDQFLGTFEFYPEEGKYHYDGHRKCSIRLHPSESAKNGGLCPVCGGPLTLGVLYRVLELADRGDGAPAQNGHPHLSIIPLTDILAEIFSVGPKTKKVKINYDKAIENLGPEFDILHTIPIEAIHQAGVPLLAEAVLRMRKNRIKLSPGFDGEFGKVKIFDHDERKRLMGQKSLFVLPAPQEKKRERSQKQQYGLEKTAPFSPHRTAQRVMDERPLAFEPRIDILAGLNDAQKRAVIHDGGPQIIVAGPGTGKTRTLTCKIAYLISEKKISAGTILAVTFTNKAAQEMRERIDRLLPNRPDPPPRIATIHAFCYALLTDHRRSQGAPDTVVIDAAAQRRLAAEALRQTGCETRTAPLNADRLMRCIAQAKQGLILPGDPPPDGVDTPLCALFQSAYRRYEEMLRTWGAMDFEDLIFSCARLFHNHPDILEKHRRATRYLFVDEYQDLNHAQHHVLRLLAQDTDGFCVIGDPDQAIYGFRGSDPAYFKRFSMDFPGAAVFSLQKNYRSTQTILRGSYQVIRHADEDRSSDQRATSDILGTTPLVVLASASEKAEAVAVGKTIENLIGGTGFESIAFNKAAAGAQREYSLADVAVLYRTRSQAAVFADAFEKAGIPCQTASRDRPWEEKGVRELISFFKLVEGLGQFSDLERILDLPGSGIGRKTADKLKEWVFEKSLSMADAMAHIRRFPLPEVSKPAQRKLDRLISEIQNTRELLGNAPIEARLEQLRRIPRLASALARREKASDALHRLAAISRQNAHDTAAFFSALSLQSDTDMVLPGVEKVALMTLHAAKGLEFPVVFITGCEEGLIPYAGPEEECADVNEERRLFFVAMTRAKERLYLTWSKRRTIYGKTHKRRVSPFVRDIEEQLLRHERTSTKSKKKAGDKQLPLFS